jgi:ribosomal protein L11 methylase PrmA
LSAPPLLWTEVRVLAPEAWLELVAEALALGPCTSVAFGRPSLAADAPPQGFDYVRTFLLSSAATPAERARIVAAVRGLAAATGAAELGELAIEFKELPPEDYASSWKKSWKPFRVHTLCVLPAWSRSRPRPGERVLRLEPGGAFGTGRHATTRTCLKVLQARIRGGERVLDCGSGSGILAVTAVLLGAREALGFDFDPTAEPYARALALDNGLEQRCTFVTGGFECLRGSWDVVLANIYADILQEHADELARRLAPGRLVRRSAAARAARRGDARGDPLGGRLSLEEVHVRGRWHTFVGRR